MLDSIARSKAKLEKERQQKQRALLEEAKNYNIQLMNTKKKSDERNKYKEIAEIKEKIKKVNENLSREEEENRYRKVIILYYIILDGKNEKYAINAR